MKRQNNVASCTDWQDHKPVFNHYTQNYFFLLDAEKEREGGVDCLTGREDKKGRKEERMSVGVGGGACMKALGDTLCWVYYAI